MSDYDDADMVMKLLKREQLRQAARLDAVELAVDNLHSTGAISQDAADQLYAALEGKS